MTEPTTSPRATVCPEAGCRALIPATTEDRREHRAGHLHTAKVERAIRDELKAIRALAAEIRGEHSALRRAIDDIEIPDPVEPLAIEEWPEDELAEPEDDLLAEDDEHDDEAPADNPFGPLHEDDDHDVINLPRRY